MPITLKRYTRCLTASGLMSAAEVKAFQRQFAAEARPSDAQQLARALVRAGRLTKYQAAMLYRGTTKGLVLGNYTILDEIGAGGMGQVFKAWHRRMERTVALKVLPKEATRSKDSVRRFQREVKAAARLSHPHIVTAYDSGEADGIHFLVMEYIQGANLAEVLKEQGPLPLDEAVGYVVQAARGLAYAHSQGVVHRDVKPSNLLIDERGTVRILDLGLARFREQLQEEEAAAGRDITTTGQVVGTVEYMAPEQAEDTRQADQRADIYGLGCTLYRLVTGELPYRGETVVQLILAHREQSVPSLRGPRGDVPLQADQVFRKMVAKSPSDRYQTMDEVIAAFERIGFGGSGRGKPREAAGPAGRRGGAVAAGASGGSSSWNTPAERPEATRRTSASWILLPTVLVLIALAALRATDWHDADEGGSAGLAGGAGGQVDLGAEQARFAEWAAAMGLPLTATNSIGMTLRLIPPGEFLMGGGSEEVAAMRQALEADGAGAGDWALSPIADELPRHPVRITRPFYIGTHEVTVAEFRAFVADAGYTTEAEKSVQAGAASPPDWRHPGGFTQSDRHPVVQVSWRDASAFCQWLSRREGVEYHLPTEAQWEYACRAGGSAAWSFGHDGRLAARHAWFGPNAGQRTHQVGLLEPNGFGLFDMHGNVLEWCLDGARGYTADQAADPLGPGDGPRVVRGGDYAAPNAWCLRSALRIACAGDPSRSIGLRVARRIESSELAGPGAAAGMSR